MRVGIRLPLLAGGFSAIDTPAAGSSLAEAEHIFEEGCSAVSAEWEARQRASDVGASNWAHIVCYQFLAKTIDNGFHKLFDERIRRLERGNRGRSGNINKFQRGLLALFAHDKGYFSEKDREYFGKRFWYAYRHYVPGPFLIGFLSQYWKDDISQRALATSIAPEMEEWVWFQRARDAAPELRGTYPASLEEAVQAMRMFSHIITEHGERKARMRGRKR